MFKWFWTLLYWFETENAILERPFAERVIDEYYYRRETLGQRDTNVDDVIAAVFKAFYPYRRTTKELLGDVTTIPLALQSTRLPRLHQQESSATAQQESGAADQVATVQGR